MDTKEVAGAVSRLASGVPGLDVVLGGGLLRGAVYIIQGVPGTGKTILAHQVAFENIRHGGRTLYVTVLSENHARMMKNMRTLSFYDSATVPDRLYYMSGYATLEEEGLKGLTNLIRRELESRQADLLVFDGLTASEKMTPSTSRFKQFVHDLQSISTLLDCSMLLLTSADDNEVLPEQTMVEGVLDLSRRVPAAQSLRYIEVKKFRGSDFIDGRHAMDISASGVSVYPRLESIYGEPTVDDDGEPSPKISTGVANLDTLVNGGFSKASTTLLLGPSGSGKTTLGLSFLSKSTPQERGCYFGFFETPNRARKKARSLGVDAPGLEAAGALSFQWEPPTERVLDPWATGLSKLFARSTSSGCLWTVSTDSACVRPILSD